MSVTVPTRFITSPTQQVHPVTPNMSETYLFLLQGPGERGTNRGCCVVDVRHSEGHGILEPCVGTHQQLSDFEAQLCSLILEALCEMECCLEAF